METKGFPTTRTTTHAPYRFDRLAAVFPLFLLVLSLQFWIAPQRAGVFALAQIAAPYLFFPLLLLVPIACLRRAARLRILLLTCLIVYLWRYCSWSGAIPPDDDPRKVHITAMTWNVYAENPRADILRSLLDQKPADIVALQEVRWPDLYADPALDAVYPYRLDQPDDSAPGIALLSTYPIRAHGIVPGTVNATDSSGVIWARVDVGGALPILVLVGHPNSPYVHAPGCGPLLCFDPRMRDRQLTAVRAFLEPSVEEGEPLLLLGDLNVTDREPTYGMLTAGLQDAQRRVHVTGGATWRPLRLGSLPIGLLRIDYILSSKNVTPLTLATDCTPRGSDHCIIRGTFAVNTAARTVSAIPNNRLLQQDCQSCVPVGTNQSHMSGVQCWMARLSDGG